MCGGVGGWGGGYFEFFKFLKNKFEKRIEFFLEMVSFLLLREFKYSLMSIWRGIKKIIGDRK